MDQAAQAAEAAEAAANAEAAAAAAAAEAEAAPGEAAAAADPAAQQQALTNDAEPAGEGMPTQDLSTTAGILRPIASQTAADSTALLSSEQGSPGGVTIKRCVPLSLPPASPASSLSLCSLCEHFASRVRELQDPGIKQQPAKVIAETESAQVIVETEPKAFAPTADGVLRE